MQGSREYAKRLGDRLKDRIFLTIFPHLAEGFLADRKQRLGRKGQPTEEELADIFEATLTLLYRLLFLLYAESRDLLADPGGPLRRGQPQEDQGGDRRQGRGRRAKSPTGWRRPIPPKETTLYDRLATLFQAMDKGDPS